jgi:NAD+-dependent secondary alcohol dehydrogenase Adh1
LTWWKASASSRLASVSRRSRWPPGTKQPRGPLSPSALGISPGRCGQLTDGKGAEVVIDFVGEGGAEQWGVDIMRPGASLFVVGYGGTLNVPTMKIILEELNFIGNLVGTYIDLVELMVLAAQGKVHLRTKEYPLEEINTAFDDLNQGRLAGARAL